MMFADQPYELIVQEKNQFEKLDFDFEEGFAKKKPKTRGWIIFGLILLNLFFFAVVLHYTQSAFSFKNEKLDHEEELSCGFKLSKRSKFYKTQKNTKYFTERELVRKQFLHAWNNYVSACTGKSSHSGFPMGDELVPGSTCSCAESMGGYSLTLIDAADTLVVMGELDLFGHAIRNISLIKDFNIQKEVSFFETTIRILGGLISSHLLAEEIFDNYDGKLLQLSVDLGDRLLNAIKGPDEYYGIVFLGNRAKAYGFPSDVATVGSNLLEFGYLSKLTGNPKYYKAAKKVMVKLFEKRTPIDFIGNYIGGKNLSFSRNFNVGAGMDSYLEYLLKGYFIFHDEDLLEMYEVFEAAIEKYVRYGGAVLEVDVYSGRVMSHISQSLAAFWGGMQVLSGNLDAAKRLLEGAAFLSKSYPFLPELYDIQSSKIYNGYYKQRPELMESISYMSQAFEDPGIRHFASYFVQNVDTYLNSTCGYNSLESVQKGFRIENQQESFLLAETFKYSYLIFDENNVFNRGLPGKTYVYTTEAHPLPVLVATDKQKFKRQVNVDPSNESKNSTRSTTKRKQDKKTCSYTEWKMIQRIFEMSSPDEGYQWRKVGEFC